MDAFIVALNQASDEGRKRWYASTLDLQVVSLELCRACRSIPTLHVRVRERTPRSLWSPRQTQARRITRGSKKLRDSSRVPVVRALRLTWLGAPAGRSGAGCSHRAADKFDFSDDVS